MLFMIVALVVGLGTAGAVFSAFQFITKRTTASVGVELSKIQSEVTALDDQLKELIRYKDGYCSKPQFEEVSGQLSGARDELEKEREALKGIEAQLDTSQQQVETKEAAQQEMKSSKEEDEIKLEEILSSYQDLSSESVALEQQLAQSLKNLEAIMAEVTLTDDQKEVLNSVNEAMEGAGQNLRDLITEYEGVKDRLTLLREQHEDLEEEYTKLVEQQLGE